jgi:hypothetical protein
MINDELTGENEVHETSVTVERGRYPYRPDCTCGQEFRGYVAEHAAREIAEAHARGEI